MSSIFLSVAKIWTLAGNGLSTVEVVPCKRGCALAPVLLYIILQSYYILFSSPTIYYSPVLLYIILQSYYILFSSPTIYYSPVLLYIILQSYYILLSSPTQYVHGGCIVKRADREVSRKLQVWHELYITNKIISKLIYNTWFHQWSIF